MIQWNEHWCSGMYRVQIPIFRVLTSSRRGFVTPTQSDDGYRSEFMFLV